MIDSNALTVARSLGNIEAKVDQLLLRHTKIESDLALYDVRLRSLEAWKNRLVGIAAAVGVAGGAVSKIALDYLSK